MTRYWFEFPTCPHLPMGSGVTAHSLEQARDLIEAWPSEWGNIERPLDRFWSSAIVISDVNVSELQAWGDLPLSHFCLPCNVGI